MIFYNYEDYFGKPRKMTDEGGDGPDTSYKFDYGKYQWMMMVQKICEKLNYKEMEVYDLNYISCINWLSMWDQQEKTIESWRRQEAAKNKY